jgi:integrase
MNVRDGSPFLEAACEFKPSHPQETFRKTRCIRRQARLLALRREMPPSARDRKSFCHADHIPTFIEICTVGISARLAGPEVARKMTSYLGTRPTLFDIDEDVNSAGGGVTQPLPRKIALVAGGSNRSSLAATAAVQDGFRVPSKQPKQRKTYQFGTLILEPRKRSPARWVFRYSEVIDGKKVRRKVIVGTELEYPTRTDALRACEHLRMGANAEFTHVQVTMRGLLDRYTEQVLRPCLNVPIGHSSSESARFEYSTATHYRWAVSHYIRFRWQGYAVRDFEKPEIQAAVETWLRSLLRSENTPHGLAPKSVGSVHAVMRQVFKFGVKWGYLTFNPFSEKRVELPRGCTKRLKTPTQISPKQFLTLISNLKRRERLAVSFDGWLASRVSEPFGVKWEDLDLQVGKVTFRRGYVQGRFSHLKTEASRTDLSIPKDVVEQLLEWRALTPYNRPTDWVFASPFTRGERPFHPRSIMNNIQPVALALGLPHIGWHTLRHSFSAWAKEAGLPIENVKTLLRHQTLKMTSEVYGTVGLENKRKSQEKVVAYVKKQGRAKVSDVPIATAKTLTLI